jgi:hypothetical protein
MGARMKSRLEDILEANAADVDQAKAEKLSDAKLDRLRLDEKRIDELARSLDAVAAQPDPVGKVVDEHRAPSGITCRRVRVPLGVILMIYESRPNVTSDAAAPKGVSRVQIEEATFRANDYLWAGSMGILGFLGQAILIFFLVYFLLASGDLYKRKVIKLVGPALSQKKLTIEILGEISSQIQRYLLVQAFTSLLVAVVTGMALWLLGVNQAAVWGIAAGIVNSIPYFGPIVMSATLAIVAFLVKLTSQGALAWGRTLANSECFGSDISSLAMGADARWIRSHAAAPRAPRRRFGLWVPRSRRTRVACVPARSREPTPPGLDAGVDRRETLTQLRAHTADAGSDRSDGKIQRISELLVREVGPGEKQDQVSLIVSELE